MKNYLNFSEVTNLYENAPKLNFIWGGIKEKSVGLIFGPSKSGKTTFCENMAMSIASGKKEFMGNQLDGIPKKVLFVGLEEFYLNRAERNLKQFNALDDDDERALINKNFMYQSTSFPRQIKSPDEWNELELLITESSSEIVFIDSITRLNSGKLEDSRDAEKLIQNLRNLSQDLGVTIICVHHTPKLYDNEITLDSIKGSSVFAQESDFAIAIGRTSKNRRYLKYVFYRYSSDDFDKVTEIDMDEGFWFYSIQEMEESQIIAGVNKIKNSSIKDCVVNYMSDSSKSYNSNEVIQHVMDETGLQKRQIQTHLAKLVTQNEIKSLKRGVYVSVDYKKTYTNNDERTGI
jgi:archaellum biogenesis ATPase FlaH